MLFALVVTVFVLYKLWAWNGVGKAIVIALCAALIFNVKDAVWPSDGFYVKEFERETKLRLGKGVEVLYKFATFPDFHGDYYSKAALLFSDDEFSSAMNAIRSAMEEEGVSSFTFY